MFTSIKCFGVGIQFFITAVCVIFSACICVKNNLINFCRPFFPYNILVRNIWLFNRGFRNFPKHKFSVFGFMSHTRHAIFIHSPRVWLTSNNSSSARLSASTTLEQSSFVFTCWVLAIYHSVWEVRQTWYFQFQFSISCWGGRVFVFVFFGRDYSGALNKFVASRERSRKRDTL